jgi:MoxR-like ATPase
VLHLQFNRIQFTPDLMPSDITGTDILEEDPETGHRRYRFLHGPIFANIVLADEINRASPKTQSALLEAMQEGQVTIEGETLPLPMPFLVLATQNPIEYEGTFPLPEAQLDRFMLKLAVGYPSMEEEKLILRRRRERRQDEVVLREITSAEQVLQMREAVEGVHVNADLENYIALLVHATRTDRRVSVGASPRGSLAFLKVARANAAIENREFITPDDIKRYAIPVLGHRVILQPEFWMSRQVTDDVIRDTLDKTPVPVVK